ncbi:hypothetical protein BDW74DRAFT_181798 [Aspergillus multicolor]|uniref:uncharacterized protein n=1 Tax=Aspergillus multicolor TaxID=41759 RepID=UPI003CCE3CF2
MSTSAKGLKLLIWVIVFGVFTTLVVALRFWTDCSERKSVKVPGYLVLLAYLACVGKSTVQVWAICNGLGKPVATLNGHEIDVYWKFLLTDMIFWLVGSAGCKLSMLTLYLTLFGSTRHFRITICIGCAMTGVYFAVTLALFLGKCYPFSQTGAQLLNGSCRKAIVGDAMIAMIGFNIALDVGVAVLPIPMLWELKIPRYKKVLIAGMSLMGLSVVTVICWRLYITANPTSPPDVSVALARATLAQSLELWLSIIVISLPSLAPLPAILQRPLMDIIKNANPNELHPRPSLAIRVHINPADRAEMTRNPIPAVRFIREIRKMLGSGDLDAIGGVLKVQGVRASGGL